MKFDNSYNPPCQYFSKCGGCSLQNLNPTSYQNYKKKTLQDLLSKNKIELEKIGWSFSLQNSRRRVTFQVNKNYLGFFKERSKDVVKIQHCLVLEKELSNLIPELQNLLKKITLLVEKILATKFDNGIALILKTKDEPNIEDLNLLTEFVQKHKIISLSYSAASQILPIFQLQTPKLFFGNITLDLEASIFLQATKFGEEKITTLINNFIAGRKLRIIDLYCGIGTYGFAILSQNTQVKITAFEGEGAMIKMLNENALKNNLKQKILGYERDLVQSPLNKKELENFDLAIINPPRNGAKSQIEFLAKSNLKNIIYVSCNPKTFIFDAKNLLNNGYEIIKIEVIDQFIYSSHIELIAIFNK